MTRLIVLFAAAASLSGCATSPFSSTPNSGAAPAGTYYYQPGVPRSQFECMTDEGYGRSTPCGNKS
ncbi:MAG TPA: hypothetical protein VJT13_13255 [Xanthobacteraceae bacterium]|nr:hypothetical protein [Xanthobacteraceae bacterium]